MTLDEINKLPAGRELDALVAEKVFGWQWWRSSVSGRRAIFAANRRPKWFKELAHGFEELAVNWDAQLPRSSTDILAAWTVWNNIGGPTISKQKDGRIWVWVKEDYMGPDEVAEAETAPHAICKAALVLAEEGRLPE